ncbi:MAG TPA: hypothetical protein HA366_00945, partial [Candidatus Methanomethylophilaceae archaeon]|nr:hypothetical protein [Candidatus Methanomethylophilaceae archaeon]
MRREEVLKDKVRAIDFDKINSVADLMEAYKDSSTQSRALANCAAVLENAMNVEDRPTIILGLSGALVAGG